MQPIVNNIFSVNEQSFTATALTVFKYQYLNNNVYGKWVDSLNVRLEDVTSICKIPFLPIQFFKTQQISTGKYIPQAIFESSGTTGSINSRHFVKDVEFYKKCYTKGFEKFYGHPGEWCILGLLPSYLERNNSSLVMMVDGLIKQSNHLVSGFYLNDFQNLSKTLHLLEAQGQRTLLIGVTFALLDFAEQFPMELLHTKIMETGGMKGRRREMVREEVHGLLRTQFGIESIHSEYGMTELLSQAYAEADGIFSSVPWMKVLVRDNEDPLSISKTGKGGLNIIDLANLDSCSFIATEDSGECFADGKFAVTGRIEASDIRGCGLMYTTTT